MGHGTQLLSVYLWSLGYHRFYWLPKRFILIVVRIVIVAIIAFAAAVATVCTIAEYIN